MQTEKNTHSKHIVTAGVPLAEAKKALVMVHGRGSSANDILSLAPHLSVRDFALAAPQATGNTWYPYSFMAPAVQNEPWLSSAIAVLRELVDEIVAGGIPARNIYLLGFSQGACLTLEFSARYAEPFGGIVAFTGGLIGKSIQTENYQGDFQRTPVFMGSGDPDPHVPVSRVNESSEILRKMNATVTEKIYPGRPHTISADEIRIANEWVFGVDPA